jgi:GrpB-like predicted nucleotidyltransferase (UPF0157 family)
MAAGGDGGVDRMISSVVAHDPRWAARHAKTAARVVVALTPLPVTRHHIGSTAETGIMAKPISDVEATLAKAG